MERLDNGDFAKDFEKKLQSMIEPFLPDRFFYGFYTIENLPSGKSQIYRMDKVPVGKAYDNLEVLRNEEITGRDDYCHAIKVTDNGHTFYISPIDKEQTKLNNELESVVLTSFISDASQSFQLALSFMEMEERMKKRERNLEESKLYKPDVNLEIKRYLRSPISPNVNDKLYNEHICEVLASRFYTLVEEYKQMIRTNTQLKPETKEKFFNEFFPEWEEKTLRNLFEISQNSKLKDPNSPAEIKKRQEKVQRKSKINEKLKNASLTIKDNLTKEEYLKIKKMLEENSIENGGTLEYPSVVTPCVVLENKGEVVGFVGLTDMYRSIPGKNELYIAIVGINKLYQGSGVAEKMYDFLKEYSEPFDILTCDVRTHNKNSQKFHKKVGFKILGDRDTDDMVYIKSDNHKYKCELQDIEDRKPFEIGVTQKYSRYVKDKALSQDSSIQMQ